MIGKQLKIAVKDHSHQAFKPNATGSTAAGTSSSTTRIARVFPG
jgi:hypothetical protein